MMKKLGLIAAVVCVLSCPWAAAQEGSIRQFDVPTLEKLGHDMYLQDRAAWHASDALIAVHPQADLLKEKVRGWIVEDRPDGQLVRFIRTGDTGPEAAYDISNASGKPVVTAPQDRNLTGSEKAQYFARDLALKSVTQRCGDNYNTVVLKDPAGPGWLAWALAATSNPNLVMAGGHHRLTVSADGTQVVQMDALSRSCAMLQKGGSVPAGGKLAGLLTTQLVSNLPVETFVFLSLNQGLPIFVMTPDRTLWRVADGKISQINAPAQKPDAK
ncbi:MAG TPA: hypothetical protein VH189_07840 [Rhizomicrobium sp.]|nr:hypothetical protein [Rhizomicrobium sp.]